MKTKITTNVQFIVQTKFKVGASKALEMFSDFHSHTSKKAAKKHKNILLENENENLVVRIVKRVITDTLVE